MNLISNQKGIEKTRYIFYGNQLIGIFPIDTLEQMREVEKHHIPESILFSQIGYRNHWVRVHTFGKGGQSIFLSDIPKELLPTITLLDIPLPPNYRPDSTY